MVSPIGLIGILGMEDEPSELHNTMIPILSYTCDAFQSLHVHYV